MSNFKFIRELGLEVAIGRFNGCYTECIRASDLEAVLAKGVRVYGCRAPGDELDSWHEQPISKDDKSALLIAITPLRRERSRELTETQVLAALARANLAFDSAHKGAIEELFGQGTDKAQCGGEV